MQKSKVLTASAYIFWIPALYIVLSKKRRDEFVGFHGGQAFRLWLDIFLIFFALRFLINLLWSVLYVPYLDLLEVLFGFVAYGYALYCGWRCYQGINFKIPH